MKFGVQFKKLLKLLYFFLKYAVILFLSMPLASLLMTPFYDLPLPDNPSSGGVILPFWVAAFYLIRLLVNLIEKKLMNKRK